MEESFWDICLDRLVAETRAAIATFAQTHRDEEVCYFAYDAEPHSGYVLTCFNTTRQSQEFVRAQRNDHVAYRQKLLADPVWFQHAYYQAKANAVLPFCNNTGDFGYQGFTTIEFPEWQAFAESAEYPAGDDDSDYLTNRAARLFCRAFVRLVQEQAFAELKLAQPTLLGFAFHDDEQVIVEMLGIPSA